jgi:hypothetical protein
VTPATEAGIADHVWSIEENRRSAGDPMTLNNTTIALDILVLLGILVSVEWVVHVS